MRWSAMVIVLLVVGVSLPLAGCKSKDKDADMKSGSDQAAYYEPAPTPSNHSPYDSYAVETPRTDSYEAVPASEPLTLASTAAPRYHTVSRKETLYSIARTYYGDQRKWKAIFEANADQINDPNQIYVGQKILIP